MSRSPPLPRQPRAEIRNRCSRTPLLKGAAEKRERDMLWTASTIHGYAIEATDGTIGSVDDFLFSDDSWIIRWAVVDTGNWLRGRQVLLPLNRLKLPDADSRTLSVALTRKQVEDSPEIDRDPPVSRQQEMRIYSHFGWEPYWASMGASAALGEPAMTPPVVEPRPMEPLGATGDPCLHAAHDVTGYYIHAQACSGRSAMGVGYQLVRASRHIGDDPRADRKSAGLRSRAARQPNIRAAAVRALWPAGLLAVSGS